MTFQDQINYLQEIMNDDMFTGVSVPDPLDPETLKSQIVFRCGLLDPVYSEPHIMQAAITQFFKTEQWNINHLINIILAEYSPIENTDKYSEHTTEDEGSGTVTLSGTDRRNITNSGADQREIANSGTDIREIQESGDDITTREISAFNSANYQPDNKETLGHGKRTEDDLIHGKTTDDNISYGKITEDSTTYGRKTEDSKNGKSTYTEHTHGNIGVTTNQTMINEELELLEAFDVYDWIARKLEKELFLQVY